MSANIVDVDAFTSPVVVPTDGDALSAASVIQGFQPLSDRTRNNKSRLDALPAFSVSGILVYGRYGLNTGGYADDAILALTAIAQSGGFAIASDEISVPAVGLYLVTLRAEVSSGEAGDDLRRAIELELNGSVIGACAGMRFKNLITVTFPLQGFSNVYSVTDVAHKFRLRADAPGAGGIVIDANAELSIARIK
jgi:hypothetical protein